MGRANCVEQLLCAGPGGAESALSRQVDPRHAGSNSCKKLGKQDKSHFLVIKNFLVK